MHKIYKGWSGVRKLAEEHNLDWTDVCDLIWLRKNKKRPSYRWIVLCGLIYDTLIKIKGKQQFKLGNKIYKRTTNEQDIHFAIRINKLMINKNYTINNRGGNRSDFFKSVRQKYLNTFKKYSKEIKSHKFDF